MLAAKQHRQPIAIEDTPDRRFHPTEHGFGEPEMSTAGHV